MVGTAFVEVTEAVGVRAPHGWVPDYVTTGQAFGDFDGDGLLDLYVTDSVGANYLYRNTGEGAFEIARHQRQVALESATSGGAIFVDYDSDGDQDLYVLNLGPNVLLRNDGVRGFTDVSARAGLDDPGKGQQAAWADYDGDGDLDVYVVNWWCVECEGTLWSQATDRLYENRGDGTFRDVTAWLGDDVTDGAGFAASWLDHDSDGDLDLYVVNDKGFDGPRDPDLPLQRNAFFVNQGPGCDGWCFEEVARRNDTDLRIESMGIAVGDVDNDFDLDVLVSNGHDPKLLINEGDSTFIEQAAARGILDEQTGWGTAFLDYDNDGDLDVYYVVGTAFGPVNTNRLWQNEGRGFFRSVDDTSGATNAYYGVGLAVADYDRDGGLDLVVGGLATGYRVYRNLAAARSKNHWTRVRLVGRGPVPRDAIGARVYITRTDGEWQMAEVKAGSSQGAGNDLALHFGLGQAEIDTFEVRWPDGTVQHVDDVPVDRVWTLTYDAP